MPNCMTKAGHASLGGMAYFLSRLPGGVVDIAAVTRIFLVSALVPVLILLFTLGLTSAAAATECEAKPIVAKIHADWCGSCRATKPTWDEAVATLSDQAIWVEFDVTDRASYSAAVKEADRLGLGDFLQEFRRQTGTIAVLDCDSKKTRAVLTGERDLEKYGDAIAEALEN